MKDQKIRDKLLRVLGHVIFSLDGATADTYNQVRIGSDFDRVISNIEAFCQSRLVIAAGPDAFAFLPHDNGGARVLTHRQYSAGGDICILQQIEGDKAVIVRGFGVVKNFAQLGQMTWTQKMVDVAKSLRRQNGQRLRFNLENGLAVQGHCTDMIGRNFSV